MRFLLILSFVMILPSCASKSPKVTPQVAEDNSASVELLNLLTSNFSEKQIKTNPSLCNYYNELAAQTNKEKITCPRVDAAVKSEADVMQQVSELNQTLEPTSLGFTQ